MKIISWNIMFNHPLPLSQRILNIKKLIPSDTNVICFQEVLKSDTDLVSKTFSNYKLIVKPANTYGQLVMIKTSGEPRVYKDEIPLYTKQGRVANKISIRSDSQDPPLNLDIFTFHLESMPYNVEARMNQMVEIYKHINTSTLTILCGDTNMSPLEHHLFGPFVKDIAAMLDDEQPTYFGDRFGKYASQKRYDKAFICGDNPVSLDYIRLDEQNLVSDHDGLIIDLKL